MNNSANFVDINCLLLAFPVNMQTGTHSEIERQLSWSIWGWLLEQFLDAKYGEGNHGK